ncbi:J domain-containing protein required for chloroplast accumulation response 1 isoform X2 [Punica granatum]|uniref:J domain-containing protein required for chloroplast accumulation response 1 isoform X2 n=1 Tax=Punica granatum TaxID=22663 RepID=A0A218WQF5_PUNGR|nr:J domain-containing protein required for chloroplast accumulation response 1 isoform X2 [Punica granatum]OWM75084.1 hypothetical protein CDL15_Pgr021435 [Punica granatum]
MERESTVADYRYSSYGSSSPTVTYFRKSDIDFRDVFGGPPRRSSIHEMMRHSFTEGADSLVDSRGFGETPSIRDPWTDAEEKPVFGGGGEGGNRRRYLQEDFFVDIFGGSESPTTPRKHDRDVFSASSPGSRALSPAWPLPPQAEGLSSGPTQFSLPDTLSKSVDSPAFGSIAGTSYKGAASNGTSHLHSPKISVFGFSSRTVQVHDETRNSGTHYRPSPLSQQFSLGTEDSSGLIKPEKPNNPEKDKGDKQDVTSSSQFHFSIYKWASKGIPSMMPLRRVSSLRLREKSKTESSSFTERMETRSEISESPSATPLNVSFPSNSREENQSLRNLSLKIEVEASQSFEDEVLPSQYQETVAREWNSTIEDISVRSTPIDNDRQCSSPTLSNSRRSLEKEMHGGLQEGSGPDLKPLRTFFDDKDEQSYSKDMIDTKRGRTTRTERSSTGLSKNGDAVKGFQRRDKDILVQKSKVEKVIKKGSPRSSEDDTGKKRSKGKVKEFIKIFNQESKTSVHPQSQSFMKKERGTSEATQEENIHRTVAIDEKVTVTQSEKPTNASNKVVDPHIESQKEYAATNNANDLFSDTSSGQKNNSASSMESVPDDAKISVEEADELSHTYFTIKELPQDENKQGQPTEDREEIQAIDAKIRQWSRGKEGNIRSLLSTLQYVLWPGSGWKPVPLVDIIEGPAVKRAYQRALLYLHPDKLQQKCAAPHQKYIAQQVFEILQEAWNHFNTLGSL